MKRLRILLAAALSASMAFGHAATAWAQAAALGTSVSGSVAPVPAAGLAVPNAGITSAGSLSPAAASLDLGGVLPSVPQLSVSPSAAPVQTPLRTGTALPAGVRGAALQTPSPAAETAGTVRRTQALTPHPGRRSARARTARLVRETAPAIEAAADEKASPNGLKSAGRTLFDILTGRSSRKYADASAAPGVQESIEDNKHPSAAAWGLHCAGCDHDHGFETEHHHDETPPPPLTTQQERNFHRYRVGISAVKIGIETLNLVVPILMLTQFHSATLVGTLFIASDLAGLAFGWLSGPFIDRLKPSRVLAAAAAVQMLSIGVLPAAFALGTAIPLSAFFALFMINGAMLGVVDIARRAELPQIVGRHEGNLREYNAKLYIWREVAAITGVLAAGWLARSMGYLPALWLHPAFYALAAYLFMRLALSKGLTVLPAAEKSEGLKKPKLIKGFSEFLRGARLVLTDPMMRTGFFVNFPLTVVHKLFHAMLAAVYATAVLGNPAYAAVILGAWNFGELAGAWYLKKRGKKEKSFGWLPFLGLAGLSVWLMWLFPSIFVAAPVSFLLAGAMIRGEIGIAAFYQAKAEDRDVGAITSFVYSAATGTGMGALLAMGWLFDAFSAQAGFLFLAAFMTAAAGFYLLAWRRLRKTAQAPPATEGPVYPDLGE